MDDRTQADRIVRGAYNNALLELILDPMRKAAKDAGYALLEHGSKTRDIDLCLVAWVEKGVADPDDVVQSIAGAARGVVGRCNVMAKSGGGLDFTQKPHGRRAYTVLVWCGENTAHLDVSVIPPRDWKPEE